MSGAADAVVLAPLFDFLDEKATLAVGASALACYRAAKHLPDAYNAAMNEFRGRAEVELNGLFTSKNAHDLAMQSAAQLVERAQTPLEDANLSFLNGQIEKLRARSGEDSPPDVKAMFETLQSQIAASPAEIVAHWREFETLQSAISKTLLERAARETAFAPSSNEKKAVQIEFLRAELENLGAQLENPLWNSQEGQKARENLQIRLENLRALLETSPASSAQGLILLQGALNRARDTLAAQEQLRREKREEKSLLVRELSGTIAARAQAIAGQNELPAARESALSLLARLSQFLSSDFGDDLTQLRALNEEAENLFEQTHKTLHETAFAAYLRAQVRDVLGELGYRVADLEGEKGLVAVVDDKTGVEIEIDGNGALSSHLVAFSDAESAPVNFWAQEKACALLDEVYAGLRRRQLTVKEKKRKTLRDGDRVKTLPKSVAQRENGRSQAENSAPKTFD